MTKKLIFVYNANSGAISALIDGLHKNFMPSTYQCQLCSLSYGRVSMKKEWKEFTKALPYTVEFLHKDEFEREHPDVKATLPAAYVDDGETVNEVISKTQFSRMNDLDDLMKAVEKLEM